MYCSGGHAGVDSETGGFGRYEFYFRVVNEVIKGSGSITSATYTCYNIVGIFATDVFVQLFFYLLNYYGL